MSKVELIEERKRERRTASASSQSSAASTFKGEALLGSIHRVKTIRENEYGLGGIDENQNERRNECSPPRRLWRDTRMVETLSAGDHFSLRISVREAQVKESAVVEKRTREGKSVPRQMFPCMSTFGSTASILLAGTFTCKDDRKVRTKASGFEFDCRSFVRVFGRESQ